MEIYGKCEQQRIHVEQLEILYNIVQYSLGQHCHLFFKGFFDKRNKLVTLELLFLTSTDPIFLLWLTEFNRTQPFLVYKHSRPS